MQSATGVTMLSIRDGSTASDPHVDHALHDQVAGDQQAAEAGKANLHEPHAQQVAVVLGLRDVDEDEAAE